MLAAKKQTGINRVTKMMPDNSEIDSGKQKSIQRPLDQWLETRVDGTAGGSQYDKQLRR